MRPVKCDPEYLWLLISIKHVLLNLLSLSFILIGGLVHASVVCNCSYIQFITGAWVRAGSAQECSQLWPVLQGRGDQHCSSGAALKCSCAERILHSKFNTSKCVWSILAELQFVLTWIACFTCNLVKPKILQFYPVIKTLFSSFFFPSSSLT